MQGIFMSEGKGDSIFSLAGKKAAKPVPKVQAAPSTSPSVPEEPLSDEVVTASFQRAQKMQDELQREIDTAYAGMGHTSETATRVLDNPVNFSSTEFSYEWAQEQRRQLRNQVKKLVGAEIIESREARQASKEQEQHKRKTIGARKNWLNMR